MTLPPAPDGELPGPSAERLPPPRRHCRHCGSVVAWAAVVCLTCGCEPSSGVQHCWFCGGNTRADLQVCPGCGAGLIHPPVARPTVGRPPPVPTYPFLTTPPTGRQGHRSAVVAGVLAILLGSLGVHRFYLGYSGAGAAFLLSSFGGILYAILVVPFFFAIAASVLALVEGILLLTGAFDTDVDGARLQR